MSRDPEITSLVDSTAELVGRLRLDVSWLEELNDTVETLLRQRSARMPSRLPGLFITAQV